MGIETERERVFDVMCTAWTLTRWMRQWRRTRRCSTSVTYLTTCSPRSRGRSFSSSAFSTTCVRRITDVSSFPRLDGCWTSYRKSWRTWWATWLTYDLGRILPSEGWREAWQTSSQSKTRTEAPKRTSWWCSASTLLQ